MEKCNLIVITGPTASGKTSVAAHLAYNIDSEIISADSRQVYREMNIGTGKDILEYTVQQKTIPYHLIDILNAGEQYSVFDFQRDFIRVFAEIASRSKIPVLCGGTGFYIEAVLKKYQLHFVPENLQLRAELSEKPYNELVELLASMRKLHNTTDINNFSNLIRALEIEFFNKENPELKLDFPEIKPLVIGIKFDRDSRRRRISERLKSRLNEGMIDEVKYLLAGGVSAQTLINYGLEYKYITLYIENKLSYSEMFSKLETAIHQFAKRQMTWFRKMEKNGIKIKWLDGYADLEEKICTILKFIV